MNKNKTFNIIINIILIFTLLFSFSSCIEKDIPDDSEIIGDIIIYDDYAINTKQNITVYEDEVYNQKEEVALYLVSFKKLPANYYDRSTYNELKHTWTTSNLIACTGGTFYNREGLLPKDASYIECDIDSNKYSRGPYRIVFNTSYEQIYYTHDHYASFIRLYDGYNYDGVSTYNY